MALPQAEAEQINKLTGRGRYTADEVMPAALHAVFVRATHAHARVVSLDLALARGMPGVAAVLTAADCEAAGLRPFPVIDRVGKGLIVPDRPMLAGSKVRFAGEPVACVVAETAAQAQDAAEAVMAEYDALPAVISLREALDQTAPRIHAETPGNIALRHEVGDAAAVATAMRDAALVVRTEIDLPRLTPVTMEPRAAAARWDAASGRWFLRVPHQGINEIRRDLATAFGLPPDRFHVLPGEVGGGFGPRNIAYTEYAVVLLASRLTGRPVVWPGNRSESFLTDLQGRGVRLSGRMAFDTAGIATAVEIGYDNDLGAYISPVAIFAAVHNPLQSLTGCYAIPAAHAVFRMVHTNAPPTGPYRGAGRPEMALLNERLMDLAARCLGVDPFVLRARNAIPPDAFPWTLPSGASYDSADLPRLLDTACHESDWEGFTARKAAAAGCGLSLGRGMALFIETSGGGAMPDEATVALAERAGRPSLVLHTVTGSSGQLHARTFALIAAPRLGLAETDVTFLASAAETTLSGAGSYASRSTIAAGNAVAAAADAVARVVRDRAALRGNVPPEEVTLRDAAAWRADGTRICGIVDLLGEAICETGRIAPTQAFASGCHVAEVAVDRESGAATLLRYLAVDDAGVTIDEQAADAQIHGGIAQGVGEVLGEDYVLEAGSGQPIAASLQDYMLPRANDVPLYRTIACNTPSPANPLGVKGIGEAGTTGALCAVTSAVADALEGRELPKLPFTPMRLWQALRAGS